MLAPLANPARVAARVAASVLEPPPPVDLNRWAEENLAFGSESPFPGPYNPRRFPFFARILEVLGPDDPADTVVFKKSAQLGGTVVAQIFIAASLDLDPSGVLYVHPTEGNATRWAKTKWKPMLRSTSALRRILGAERSRDGSQSSLYYERIDGRGFMIVSGANSPASLSMITVKRQVQDDLAKWEMNEAGDPEAQSDSRSKAFGDWAKKFKVGTPLFKHNCRVTKRYGESTQERFHVPCRSCGTMQPLTWENFKAVIEAESFDPAAAHFTCVHCGERIEHRDKAWMIERGAWVAENPGAKIVGFHLWAAYSPLESWEAIARRWLAARGNAEAEQTVLNDDAGEAYEQAAESPPWEEIRDRAEREAMPVGVVPPGGLILCAAIDVQDGWLAWHVVAFGRDRRRWTVDRGTIDHGIDSAEGRAAADRLLERTWPDTFGNWRGLDQLAIDAGGHHQMDVVSWARRKPSTRVMVVRGSKFDNAPALQRRASDEMSFRGKVVKTGLKLWWVGVSLMKGALYGDLKKVDPLARGYYGFAAGLGDDFFQELCAEKRVRTRNKRGFDEHHWVKEPGQRNEMLDTALYAEAAAIRCQWTRRTEQDWDRLQAEREKAPEPTQPELFQPGDGLPAPSATPAEPLVDDAALPVEEKNTEAAEEPAAVAEDLTDMPPSPAPTVRPLGTGGRFARPRVMRNSLSR